MHWAAKPIANLIPRQKRNKSAAIHEYRDAVQIAQSDTSIKEIAIENEIHLHMGDPSNIHKNIYRGDNACASYGPKSRRGKKIHRLLIKWRTRQLEHDAEHLQKEADKGNMIPIWKYQKTLRGKTKHGRNYVLTKSDGHYPR